MIRFLAIFIALLMASPASGEPFRRPEFNPKKPIRITSDRVTINRDRNQITFIDDVDAKHEELRLLADQMVVRYAENKEGKVEFTTITATKNVRFFTENIVAAGDSGVFNIPNNTITLSGNVVINEEGVVVYGEEFIYNVQTGLSKIEGNRDSQNRVTIILEDAEEFQQRIKNTK